MNVVVVGAGGLGSYVGAVLSRAGHEVTLVARGAHASAIRANGLHVQTVHGDFVVRPGCVDSAVECEGADLAFVAVKAFSLDDVGPQVARLGEAGSVVVPLLNGVTASERLHGLGVPADRLVDGIAYMTAFRTDPGRVVRRAAHHKLVVGSSTGAAPDAVGIVATAFADTDVEIDEAPDIRVELWKKMAVVCSLSVVCALTGEAMGPIRGHPLGARLQHAAIAEIVSVGRAHDVPLDDDTEERVGAILDAFPEDFFPSVIHDLKSGRPTEMEELGGVIVRLGREAGVATPLHEAATCTVQLAEAAR